MPTSHLLQRTLLVTALACFATATIAKEEVLQLKSEDELLIAPMNVASLNRLSLAALGGTPGSVGTFLPIFDRRLDSTFTARDPGPATINVVFHRPQKLHAVRLLLADGPIEWSVAAADSAEDLESGSGTFRYILAAREGQSVGSWLEGKLESPVTVKALRLTIRPKSTAEKIVIKEANLVAEQRLETLSVKSPGNSIPLGEQVPLEIVAYFSGGETRTASGKGLKWTVRPENVARIVSQNRILGRRTGPIEVTAALGKLTAPPVRLQVVEGD